MNRRQFGLRVLGLVGGIVAALKVRPVQAAPAQLSVPMTWRKDTPLLRHMRDNFNLLCRGSSATHCPNMIYMSPLLFQQFSDEIDHQIVRTYPPHLRYVPSDGTLRFKGAMVAKATWLEPGQYMMTGPRDSVSLFTYEPA